MSKRKVGEEKFYKRQKLNEDEDLWSDTDDEELMSNAADQIEQQRLNDEWGDTDDEQLMCDAVDEYERLNQVGHGQPEPAQPPPQQPEPAQPQPALPPQAALNNSITSSTFIPTNNRDLLAAFRELEHQVQEELRRRLNRNRGIRAYITVDANYTSIRCDAN